MALYCKDLSAVGAGASDTIIVEVGEAGERLRALTIVALDASAAVVPLHQIRVSIAGVGASGGASTENWPRQVSGNATTASALTLCGDGQNASWLSQMLAGIRATASAKISITIAVVTSGTPIASGVLGLVTDAA